CSRHPLAAQRKQDRLPTLRNRNNGRAQLQIQHHHDLRRLLRRRRARVEEARRYISSSSSSSSSSSLEPASSPALLLLLPTPAPSPPTPRRTPSYRTRPNVWHRRQVLRRQSRHAERQHRRGRDLGLRDRAGEDQEDGEEGQQGRGGRRRHGCL
ncbi:hypothetical protein LTR04_000077, partial [Oleoguttula sp. CCFEE 6159]